MEIKEKDNTVECRKEIDRFNTAQSVGEAFHERKDPSETQLENQGDSLNSMADSKAEDSENNCSNITSNQENDVCDTKSQYSHAVSVDSVRISVPGNLNIIEDNSTEPETPQDKDCEKQEADISVGNSERDDTEPATADKADATQNLEREEALAALRKGQTYDEEEDFDDDDYYIDYEKYEKAKEKFVYFWKSHDIYSQWHRSDFFVQSKKFFNAEQYMMFKKAELFGDDDIAKQVLKCRDPRKIKAFGRKVSGFNQNVWQQHCLYIVKEGNMAKFLQNDNFLADILFTYPKILVEASPLDRIWGIGLAEEDPAAWDDSSWQGTNYLGFVLTEVRDDIMVKRGMIDEEDRVKYIDNLLVGLGVPTSSTSMDGYKGEGEEDVKQGPNENMESRDTNKETYYLFDKGIYSQFHHTYFEVDGIEFSSAEQYMMYKKAKLFNDDQTAKEILNKTEPKKIKHLGRQVKGFNEDIWWKHCLDIVKEGNKAKFSQNEKLKKAIVTTYPQVFAEANPYDGIWGIGLKIRDRRAEKRNTWKGKNFLGYVLTEVRDELMCEWGLLKQEKVSKYIEKLRKDWVDDATRNYPTHAFNKSDQIYDSKETDVDNGWWDCEDNKAQTNKDRCSTGDTSKGRPVKNMKTDHQHLHVVQEKYRNDNHNDRKDHQVQADVHQKHNGKKKRGHKNSAQNSSEDIQDRENNFNSHMDKQGDNKSRKDNKQRQKRTPSPLRNEPVDPKMERQFYNKDIKDQTDSNLTGGSVRDGPKKERNDKKGSKNFKGQKDIGEEDSDVKASLSSKDQGEGKPSQLPSSKTQKQAANDLHVVSNDEDAHNPLTNNDEGTSAQGLSRRQKKNMQKKNKIKKNKK